MDRQEGDPLDNTPRPSVDTFPPCKLPPGGSRRLSAAGQGTRLRRQSLGEIGLTPPKLTLIKPPASSTPIVSTPSPESFHTPTPSPVNQATVEASASPSFSSTAPASDPVPLVDLTDPDNPSVTAAAAGEISPGTNRSGKKRKLITGNADRKLKRKMTDKRTAATTGTKDKPDEDPFAKLAKMMKGIESKIAESEVRMSTKIDTLSASLETRLDRTEKAVSEAQQEIAQLKEVTNEQSIRRLVDEALARPRAEVSRETQGRRPRALRRTVVGSPSRESTPTPALRQRTDREDRYWLARRQLRLWPVDHDQDLDVGVLNFLKLKLKIPDSRIEHIGYTVEPLAARPDAVAQNQVLVTFDNIEQRDGVRAKANNLDGRDRATGCQMEPPDHLRSQYQAFQSLAYCLKKKSPTLRRNLKFDDRNLCLIMDINTGDTWKTIEYDTARDLLKRRSERTSSMSRNELREILNDSDVNKSDDSMDIEDAENTVVDTNKDLKRCPHSISFLNTNARSLGPKISSLTDCFEEKFLDIATVTETWFQPGDGRSEVSMDLSLGSNLGIITWERTQMAMNGRRYGGLAFIYSLTTCSFREFPLVNPENYEILTTVGDVRGVKGKFFIISCYAPPNLLVPYVRSMIDFISDLVCEAKRTYEDCAVIVTGDFNHWPIEEFLEDHPDMMEMQHGPTRHDRKIDRTFTNFNRSITESCTLDPLETEEGQTSDHRMTFGKAIFPAITKETVTYTYRHYSERAARQFISAMSEQDWSGVLEAGNSESKVEAFQAIVDANMEKFFPLRTTKKRKSDPPWVNNQIRRLVVKRRRVYDKEGRSARWKRLKKFTADLYRLRAQNYVKRQKELLTAPDAIRAFHKHVKAYKSREKPPEFDVCDLFPGESTAAVAETLADHFNAISKEFNGIEPNNIPSAPSMPLPPLSRSEVERRLLSFRKPKSMVAGDIFPSVINRVASSLAHPLTDIYNQISSSQTWPARWKVEHVTPIPKITKPANINDIRNISCTTLFSKVYESFVLSWLGEVSDLRPNQYGGVKGVGTEHFLVQLWQDVLEALDDSRAGVLLTSIDYSKAFNRLDFGRCLTALKEKGVGQELINLIASFLSGRTMTVKVGQDRSEPRTVEGGVPQGSLLGVHLFNSTIDTFEAFSPEVKQYGPAPAETLSAEEVEGLPQDVPNLPPRLDRDHKHLPPFEELLLKVQKYVDDNIILERLNFDQLQTNGYGQRDYHATKTQNLFRQIVARAIVNGMKVNASKTKTLLVSELKSYHPAAHFFDEDGTKIEQKEEEIKILGFHFSSRPDMAAQVASIKKKYRTRMWILRHLAHRGLDAPDLLKVYQSIILPCHDYCSVVYNSSLTATQVQALERLQSQALKCIYGYEYSYRALLEMSGLSTLKERRDARAVRFAQKAAANTRFEGWFPLAPQPRALRSRAPYQEFRAKTCRLQNSPLYDLRRKLNSLHN